MIGIMSSPPQQANAAQLCTVDDGDPVVKSPSAAGTPKMSTITSFFKPKVPRVTLDPPASDQRLLNGAGHTPTGAGDAGRKDAFPSDGSTPPKHRASTKVPKKTLKMEDGESGIPVSGKDGDKTASRRDAPDKKPKSDSLSDSKTLPSKPEKTAKKPKERPNEADSRHQGHQPGREDVSSSKKRKKDARLDSSSEDFEADRRPKIPKKEPAASAEAAIKEEVSAPDQPQGNGSVEDIFEAEEDVDESKVISYLDFLNQSIGASGEDEPVGEEPTSVEEPQGDDDPCSDVIEMEKSTDGLHQSTLQFARKRADPSLERGGESARKRVDKKRGAEGDRRKEAPPEKEDERPGPRVPEDDSVLMVSYSEFLEEKAGVPEGGQAPLPLLRAKPKPITIEAQVHTRPQGSPSRGQEEGRAAPRSDEAAVDLCHSPEALKSAASSLKRKSNVVVDASDLDLSIVTVDAASSSSAANKPKAVYSIFQGSSKERAKDAGPSKQKKPQEPPASKPPASKPPPSKPQTSKPQTSKPQTSKPQASKPQASKPQASKPQASKPQASKPQTSKPQTSKPQASKPPASKPPPSKPQTSKPQTSKPQASKPQASKPQTSKPQASKPQASKPPASKPQASKPQASKPQASKPQASKPQASKPQTSKPQASKPQNNKPQAGKPPASKPQTSKPQASKPQASKPPASKPPASKPQTSKPQASKPQASKPQASKPQTSKPQASKPQTSKPQTSKPQASKPQASKPQTHRPGKAPCGVSEQSDKPRKRSSEKTPTTPLMDKPKGRKERRTKEVVKTTSSAEPGEPKTKEALNAGQDKPPTRISTRQKVKPQRLGNSSEEDLEFLGMRDAKGPSIEETVAMTSTPKAKNTKNLKARQLLRRAKTKQLSKSAQFPNQSLIAKRIAPATDSQGAGQGVDSEDQGRRLRDLTSVLGKKVAAATSSGGKAPPKEKKSARSDKTAADVGARKNAAIKLAPMFTKEGQQTLAAKQKSLARKTAQPLAPTVVDIDESSRDSVRSEGGGGDWGGARGTADALPRNREREAEYTYQVFPTVSHVLQRISDSEGTDDWWDLPSPNSLGRFRISGGREKPSLAEKLKMGECLARLGEFTVCLEATGDTAVAKAQSFNGHPELSHETQRIILDEIKAANPRFPVNRVFKRYLAKRRGDEAVAKPGRDTASDAKAKMQKTDAKFTRLKEGLAASAKRKSEALVQGERAKRRRVAQEEGAGKGAEAEPVGKIRLRRRSSRWVIRDDDEGGNQEIAETPPARRSSRQAGKTPQKEAERKTLRMRKAKAGAKEETEQGGVKEEAKKTPEETKKDLLAGLLWTDKYQPLAGAEVIGNPQAMRRMSGWLTEWKKRAARIKKRMRQQSKTMTLLPEDDSDSDFELGSDSDDSGSDVDDESLSNAMVIVGPHGCGKTSAVYACAKELGFKIFEVNASSKRTGKQILADLGEATQSHHLSTHRHGNASLDSFFPTKSPPGVGLGGGGAKTASKKKKTGPTPKAFADFFKAGAEAAKKQGNKKTKASVGKKAEESTSKPSSKASSNPKPAQASLVPSASQDGAPTQRLTSTSLILFEDVDIVFEEDKGFLSAISTFVRTTKRPIILTTSDERYLETFEERCEVVSFRKPSAPQLATHLQLLCLAENVYAPHPDLQRLAAGLERDIRRCWLATQFWVGSGARLTHRRPGPGGGGGGGAPALAPALAPAEEGRVANSARSEVGAASGGLGDSEVKEESPEAVPRPQGGIFASVTGLCNLIRGRSEIASMLTVSGEDSSHLHDRSSFAEAFQRDSQASVYFRNLHALLPKISLRRSEREGRDQTAGQPATRAEPAIVVDRRTRRMHHRLVSSLAAFAEDVSFSDSCLLSPGTEGEGAGGGWWCSGLRPSLSLEPVVKDDRCSAHRTLSSSVGAALQVASFDRCRRDYAELQRSALGDSRCHGDRQGKSPGNPEQVLLGSEKTESDCLQFHQEESSKCPDLYPSLVSKLPLVTCCNHSSLATDYLPALRGICRSEQIREEMKIKRRFLHYLDSISLGLKKTDQIALCSILEPHRPKSPDKEESGNRQDTAMIFCNV